MKGHTPPAPHLGTARIYRRRAFVGLVTLTLQEAWGQKLAALGTGVAAGGLIVAVSLSQLSIFAHTRLVVDVSLTLSTLLIVAVTVAQGQRVVHQDLAVGSPSVVMARPMAVGLWLVGRFLGLWLAAWGLAAWMGTLTWAGMLMLGFDPPWALAQAFALIPCEVGVLLACGMVFACLGQARVAALAIVAWGAAGYMAHDIVAAWGSQAEGLRPHLAAVAQVVLPELERLHARMGAAHAQAEGYGFMVAAWAYASTYAGAWLFGGSVAMRRRRALQG